jgi:hypothetical protein
VGFFSLGRGNIARALGDRLRARQQNFRLWRVLAICAALFAVGLVWANAAANRERARSTPPTVSSSLLVGFNSHFYDLGVLTVADPVTGTPVCFAYAGGRVCAEAQSLSVTQESDQALIRVRLKLVNSSALAFHFPRASVVTDLQGKNGESQTVVGTMSPDEASCSADGVNSLSVPPRSSQLLCSPTLVASATTLAALNGPFRATSISLEGVATWSSSDSGLATVSPVSLGAAMIPPTSASKFVSTYGSVEFPTGQRQWVTGVTTESGASLDYQHMTAAPEWARFPRCSPRAPGCPSADVRSSPMPSSGPVIVRLSFAPGATEVVSSAVADFQAGCTASSCATSRLRATTGAPPTGCDGLSAWHGASGPRPVMLCERFVPATGSRMLNLDVTFSMRHGASWTRGVISVRLVAFAPTK